MHSKLNEIHRFHKSFHNPILRVRNQSIYWIFIKLSHTALQLQYSIIHTITNDYKKSRENQFQPTCNLPLAEVLLRPSIACSYQPVDGCHGLEFEWPSQFQYHLSH